MKPKRLILEFSDGTRINLDFNKQLKYGTPLVTGLVKTRTIPMHEPPGILVTANIFVGEDDVNVKTS